MRRDSGQGTVTGSPPSREAPICQAGLEEGLAELTPMSISLGGLPPNSHLCGSSRSTLRMGMLSEARRQEARTWEQCWGSVLGEERPLQAGVRKPPRPWQSQTRRLKAAAGRGPPVVWVPLTWDLKQTLTGFRGTPWRPQFGSVLLHPIKILGTRSLPTLPQGPESLAAVPSPSVRNSTSACGLRPAGGEPQASP